MKKLYRALIALCVFVIVILLLFILKECSERREDKETFEEVLALAVTPEIHSSIESLVDGDEITEEKSTLPEINLPLLKEVNPDCLMWVYVEGTNINYPVMHTPNDPEKYIHLNFYGKRSPSGTPFLDGKCTTDSENLIIYGHNMLNGTMFAGLKKYLDKSFYNEHKTLNLYFDSTFTEYEVFAVVKTKSYDPWYSYILEADESVINELSKKSIYKTDVSYEKGDTFVTLSTCYGKEDDDRLIVVAIAKH